ncbi:MAG: hypothetical protein RML37_03750 [Chitinophagales bacterium]|nr:hypothetical protein [Chitinophagales bacterium]
MYFLIWGCPRCAPLVPQGRSGVGLLSGFASLRQSLRHFMPQGSAARHGRAPSAPLTLKSAHQLMHLSPGIYFVL